MMRVGPLGLKAKEGSVGIDEFFTDLLDLDSLFNQNKEEAK